MTAATNRIGPPGGRTPASPTLLRRPRLEDRLDEAFGRRLTLVVADAGFGKSTLVTEWTRDLAARARHGRAPGPRPGVLRATTGAGSRRSRPDPRRRPRLARRLRRHAAARACRRARGTRLPGGGGRRRARRRAGDRRSARAVRSRLPAARRRDRPPGPGAPARRARFPGRAPLLDSAIAGPWGGARAGCGGPRLHDRGGRRAPRGVARPGRRAFRRGRRRDHGRLAGSVAAADRGASPSRP